MLDYHIIIYFSEEDEAYIARIPDLQGCSAHGDTPEEALNEVLVAKEAYIATMKDLGRPLPKPSLVAG